MYIYLDESGCTGLRMKQGSSPYFTLAAIVIRDRDTARAIRSAIRSLRDELKLPPRSEFKFSKCRKDIKARFFPAVADMDFTFHTFTLNKAALMPGALQCPKRLYRRVTEITLSNVLDALRSSGQSTPAHGSLIFDACGERAFYDDIAKYVNRLARWKLAGKATLSVHAENSLNEPLLQLADMVCGAEAGFRKGNDKSRALIETIAARSGTRRLWPPEIPPQNDQARRLSR